MSGPAKHWLEVAAAGVLLALTFLTRCTPAPVPVQALPAPIERHARIAPAAISALAADYDKANAALTAYRARPPCAASGPIACFDPGQEQRASADGERAHAAIDRAPRTKTALGLARARVVKFRDDVKHFSTGEPP